MGKAIPNTALGYLGGRIDNWVYRNTPGGLVVAKRPHVTAPPTEAQLTVRNRFKEAQAYARRALVDPVAGPLYLAAAAARGQRPPAVAMADFLKAPVVASIDATAYHGGIGNAIDVVALDDFEVAGVIVSIRDGGNVVLEEGAAVLAEGKWRYSATTAIAAGTAIAIEATARDRPGNTGMRSLVLNVT